MTSLSFLQSAQADPRFASVFQKAEKDLCYLKSSFVDSPAYISGWGHDFNCPACASLLTWDPLVSRHDFAGGNTYLCPLCGKKAQGKELDEAWVYKYRYQLAENLSSAALLALLGNKEALETVEKFMDFYAENYSLFPIHGIHAGRGKIMSQSLDEAVFFLLLFRALFPLRPLFSAEQKAFWKEKLFSPMCNFLLGQESFRAVHNISLWMRAAVGATALFIEDDELLREALDAPYGIRSQVENGYTKDRIWNECSLHYHYYATEALTEFLLYYREKAPSDPLFDLLREAYETPTAFFHDGFSVPALNDGWYPRTLKDYAPQILTAAAILRKPTLLYQVALLQEKASEAFQTPSFLLWGGDLLEESLSTTPPPAFAPCTLLADSRLAILRKGFTAILRAGIRRQNHMHDDYLSLSIPGISDDLGTPGYAHPLCETFYRRSFSHNTLCADGRSQPHTFIETAIAEIPHGAKGEAAMLWEGVDTARAVFWEKDALCDIFTASSPLPHTYDWFFHVQGKLLSEEKERGNPLSEEEIGYPHFTEAFSLGEGKGKVLRFATELGSFAIEILSEGELILARSPSNPASLSRETVLLRAQGKEATFSLRYILE